MDYVNTGDWKFFPEENYYEFLRNDNSKLSVFVSQAVLKYSSADGRYSESVVYNSVDGVIVKIEGSKQDFPFALLQNRHTFLRGAGLRQQGRTLVELIFKKLADSIL